MKHGCVCQSHNGRVRARLSACRPAPAEPEYSGAVQIRSWTYGRESSDNGLVYPHSGALAVRHLRHPAAVADVSSCEGAKDIKASDWTCVDCGGDPGSRSSWWPRINRLGLRWATSEATNSANEPWTGSPPTLPRPAAPRIVTSESMRTAPQANSRRWPGTALCSGAFEAVYQGGAVATGAPVGSVPSVGAQRCPTCCAERHGRADAPGGPGAPHRDRRYRLGLTERSPRALDSYEPTTAAPVRSAMRSAPQKRTKCKWPTTIQSARSMLDA